MAILIGALLWPKCMVAKSELQPRVLDEIFVRANRPRTEVHDYLSFLTEHALRITCSRAAFLTLDSSAMQSVDDISDVYRPSCRIIQHPELKSPKSLVPVREAIDRGMRPKTGPGDPYCIMSTASPNSPLDEEKIVELMLTSVCSVWVQLSDGYSPMGWLGLASDKRNAYSDKLLESLNAMLLQGMVALNRLLLREYAKKNGRDINLVGQSPKFLEFEQKLKQAASHNRASVLIRGERGSGKELAAYGIHYFSKRRAEPFVSVLTPAITESLQADELFGHERSSFTGADKVRKGKFLIAEGGTLFLDEVGNLSPALQSTLLRVLDHGEIQPVGRDLPINVIFTALEQEKLDRFQRPVKLPSLSGKMAMEVAAFLDIVLYYSVKEVEVEGGKKQLRVLQSQATETVVAKDRSGLLPPIMVDPDMGKIYDLVVRKTGELGQAQEPSQAEKDPIDILTS